MNEFSITPFRGLHLILLLLTAAAALLIFLLLRGKSEARRSRLLIGICLFNLALFAGYKLSLSMDAAYVSAYYPNGFNIFNELPLHLCNINLFLIPLGVWKRNRSVMGFSFFVAPLGALMALLFPEPLFSGFSLFLPRIFGYYVTRALLVVCGLSLATLGFYRPDPRDIPRILKTFGLLAVGAHLINLLLCLTLCPEANYFFTYGAEISVLKLFWRIIPAPLLYGLPAPLILAGYMYAVCALSRLTRGMEESLLCAAVCFIRCKKPYMLSALLPCRSERQTTYPAGAIMIRIKMLISSFTSDGAKPCSIVMRLFAKCTRMGNSRFFFFS